MLSLLSIAFTFLALALILIPSLFISTRLSVPLGFINIPRLIRTAIFRYQNEEGKRGASGVKDGKMPNHVGIILDGNRRWAEKRGLTVSEGHDAGGRRLVESVRDCYALGVKTVSVFAFSTENWGRPEDEVNYLMTQFEKNFKAEMPYFQRYEIKISVIGNRVNLSKSLQDAIREAEEATKGYEKHLIFALDYSGKYDILQACKSLAKKAKNEQIQVEDIDEKVMEEELMTKCTKFPNLDLIIRTSGEQRISNFFLWQSASAKLYFPSVLWPDFDESEYRKALAWYQQN